MIVCAPNLPVRNGHIGSKQLRGDVLCTGHVESVVWPLGARPPVTVALSLHSQWFSVLSQVHSSTDQEIREMHDEQANPQNAVVSEAGCPRS